MGMYPQGVSPYGIHDMSGNVWEWCLNEYSNPDNVQESGNDSRSLRGGSWVDYHDDARSVRRSAQRSGRSGTTTSVFGWWRFRSLLALISDLLFSELWFVER